jgi:hypothetical protein
MHTDVEHLPPNAAELGHPIKHALPAYLQQEFPDPVECYQLHEQFRVLLELSRSETGLLMADDLLNCVSNVGDSVDPERVSPLHKTSNSIVCVHGAR